MRKLTVIFFALLMAVLLAACAGTADEGGDTGTDGMSQNAGSNNQPSSDEQRTQSDDESDVRSVLVVYFSATNTTEGVAKSLAEGLGADIYEIVPDEPYTSADLNYSDNKSRATAEMNDPGARPAISGSVDNMSQYDVIFLGYPIWWGEAPRIMSTFIESYDFSGKTIVPFCTSGSSGFGDSDSSLKSAASNATWISGMRFSGSVSDSELIEWANGLGLDLTN